MRKLIVKLLKNILFTDVQFDCDDKLGVALTKKNDYGIIVDSDLNLLGSSRVYRDLHYIGQGVFYTQISDDDSYICIDKNGKCLTEYAYSSEDIFKFNLILNQNDLKEFVDNKTEILDDLLKIAKIRLDYCFNSNDENSLESMKGFQHQINSYCDLYRELNFNKTLTNIAKQRIQNEIKAEIDSVIG